MAARAPPASQKRTEGLTSFALLTQAKQKQPQRERRIAASFEF